MKWLGTQSDKAPAQASVEAETAKVSSKGKGSGRSKVTSNIPVGSVVLSGKQGLVRLTWKKGQREHYLSPGDYRIRNLRVVEKKGKETWFLSSTQPRGRALQVEAGSPLHLRLTRGILFGGKARWKGRELMLGFGLRDSQGRGLSIYRNGKRVPIRYELLSSSGKRLQSGEMNYG